MSSLQAFNPYLPSYEYVPDGEPRIFDNRLYVYGSHDRFNGDNFCLNDYVCWSAPLDNLADWRCEGIIYRAVQDPKNRRGHMHMNAPDVVQGPDGRYYLYYQLHALAYTCVAVCDTPAGHYEYYGYVEKNGRPLGNSKADPYAFDPGVLVDTNGRIWLYVGFATMSKVMRFLIGLRPPADASNVECCLYRSVQLQNTVTANRQMAGSAPARKWPPRKWQKAAQ